MALIIAARFDTFDAAQIAANQLMGAGVSGDHLHTFYVNPAGSHATYPLGGDNAVDPDSSGGSDGALAGAALLGIVGAGVGALIGYVFGSSVIGMVGGAGVGAYIGSLAGAMRKLGRKKGRSSRQRAVVQATEGRPAGVLLAVNVESEDEQRVGRILKDAGGMEVERARGRWENGTWKDFDPTAGPDLKKDVEARQSSILTTLLFILALVDPGLGGASHLFDSLPVDIAVMSKLTRLGTLDAGIALRLPLAGMSGIVLPGLVLPHMPRRIVSRIGLPRIL